MDVTRNKFYSYLEVWIRILAGDHSVSARCSPGHVGDIIYMQKIYDLNL